MKWRTMKPKITKLFRAACPILAALLFLGAGQPSLPKIQVAPIDAGSPRPLEKQTQASVVHDYLLSWQILGQAMAQNRLDLLDGSFVGVAKEKLAETIRKQQSLGIQTTYLVQSHDVKVVFYSTEGLSIQILDDVEYDLEVGSPSGALGTQHVRTRYIAVLTPTESKWKVRIFQGGN